MLNQVVKGFFLSSKSWMWSVFSEGMFSFRLRQPLSAILWTFFFLKYYKFIFSCDYQIGDQSTIRLSIRVLLRVGAGKGNYFSDLVKLYGIYRKTCKYSRILFSLTTNGVSFPSVGKHHENPGRHICKYSSAGIVATLCGSLYYRILYLFVLNCKPPFLMPCQTSI